ncbi:hypothetical protein QX776_13420 [Alteromonadaceae bacterium BrNp21-10]|nr:hypothetical protein [Alteromonadaceae bacterium BrNp21-10]
MTDLNSIGFKQSSNTDTDSEMKDDELEAVIGKTAKKHLSQQEQSNIHSASKIPEAPYIPENPINKTNEKLGDLESLIQGESSRSSQSTKNWNRIMLLVSLAALVTSALFSVLTYKSSNQSSAKLEQLILEQNALLKANLESKDLNETNLERTKVPASLKGKPAEKSTAK